MAYESPQRKHKQSNNDTNDYYYNNINPNLQLTPSFKATNQNSSVTRIVYTVNRSHLNSTLEKNTNQDLPQLQSSTDIKQRCGTNSNSSSINKSLQLSSSQSKINEVSVNKSSLKSRLVFIYNQYTKNKSDWIESFESFCLKEKLNVDELKFNNHIRTYSSNQSFIYSNEFFWLLAINYTRNKKNEFSFEDLVKLTHLAIESVKNSGFVVNKCYLVLAKQFSSKERSEYCKMKNIPYVNNGDLVKLLNDDTHSITDEDGLMSRNNSKRLCSKRKKILNNINNVSIMPQNKENIGLKSNSNSTLDDNHFINPFDF